MTEEAIGTKRTLSNENANKKRKSMYKKAHFKLEKVDAMDALFGKRGLLVSFAPGRRTYAKSELFNLIIESADELSLEYDEVHVPFKIMDFGNSCAVFCTMDWDPVMLSSKMYDIIGNNKGRSVQNLIKVLPCTATSANMEELIDTATSHLKDATGSFAVGFTSKCCEKFKDQQKRKIQLADAILSAILSLIHI